MKRTVVTALAVVLMMVGMVGSVSATIWETTTDLHQYLYGVSTSKWSMAMTTDFQIPFDIVNSAELTIYSNYVDGNNDKITVKNKYFGTLKTDTNMLEWYGFRDPNILNPLEATTFNVASVITDPWPSGSPLKVSLAYNETWDGQGWSLDPLFLDRAVLKLDYDNKTAPVPEPGTMVLLGFGMLGLVVYGKRRMNKD